MLFSFPLVESIPCSAAVNVLPFIGTECFMFTITYIKWRYIKLFYKNICLLYMFK